MIWIDFPDTIKYQIDFPHFIFWEAFSDRYFLLRKTRSRFSCLVELEWGNNRKWETWGPLFTEKPRIKTITQSISLQKKFLLKKNWLHKLAHNNKRFYMFVPHSCGKSSWKVIFSVFQESLKSHFINSFLLLYIKEQFSWRLLSMFEDAFLMATLVSIGREGLVWKIVTRIFRGNCVFDAQNCWESPVDCGKGS